MGFTLTDSRTKETTRYTLSGSTEKVAAQAAEGAIPEKHYRATNALPFMVEGIPTYVMALRDDTGIARAYAMVAIEDFQKVAIADTLAATARQFVAKVSVDKTKLDASSNAATASTKAKVLRIGSEVRAGNTSYILVLEGRAGKLFAAGIDLSESLPVTNVGDLVEVQFADSSSSVLSLLSFKNVSLAEAVVAKAPTAASVPASR